MEEAISFEKFLDLNYLTEDSLFKIKDVNESTNKLLEEYKEIAVNQVIQNFGLDKILNIYKDGGNVTTFHNYKNKIFSDKESKEKYEFQQKNQTNFQRSDYDQDVIKKKRFGKDVIISRSLSNLNKRVYQEINGNQETSKKYKESRNSKNQLSGLVNNHMVGKGIIKDGYNSENLLSVKQNNKDNVHNDHILSLKKLSTDDAFNFYLPRDEQKKFVNSSQNLTFTTGPANQSKGELEGTKWGNKINKDGRTNAERFNKNIEEIELKEKQAKKSLNKKIKVNKLKKQSKVVTTSFSSGAKMGMKEMLGMLLYDLQNEFFKEMKYYFNNLKDFHKNKVKWQELKLCFSRIKDKVFSRAKSYFVGFSTGFISGFLGNILTVIINTFKTTYKRLAKLIGETFNGLVKSVKLLLTAENNETKYKEALKIFTATVIGALGGIMTESLITYLRTTPFSIFSELIGATVGGILTAMTVATTMYMIDDFKGFIDSLKGIFTKDKYSQEELKAKFEELLNKIDEEYSIILKRIRREYLKLNEITLKAFDMKISTNERLTNTAIYASTMNVKENEIVEDLEDIDDFFFN